MVPQSRGLANDVRPETGPKKELSPQFRRTLIGYPTKEPAGTIIIDTPNTYLYLVLGNGKALRYGVGVGREGFTWSGAERVTKMAEWPDWNPPEEMIVRQPYLPRFMAGGETNPLGARALYLGKTVYRIHGTNQPSTIGTFVSSGCIRLTNEDVTDPYTRVKVGTRVVVLPGPVICPATDATAITENDAQQQGRDNYLFRVGMYGTGQANFMVDTMVKKFGHTKVGLLTWTGGWGVTGRGELQRRLKENGLTPVADETFDNNDTDMTPQIIKLKNGAHRAFSTMRSCARTPSSCKPRKS